MSQSLKRGRLSAPVLLTLGLVALVALLIATQGPTGKPSRQTSEATPPPKVPDTGVIPTSPRLMAPPDATPPVGEFYYLVDVSASTKNASGQSPFEEGIALLPRVFATLRSMEELAPQRHRVATIGALSLSPTPRCDIYVPPKTLFTGDSAVALADRAMRGCELELRQLTPERYTDISGALVNAGISLNGQRRALRGIVLVSDLDEDRPAGTVAGHPDLRTMCVVIYQLVTQGAARDPSLMQGRASEWKSKLRKWGAADVYVANARGFDEVDLRNFFQSCEGR